MHKSVALGLAAAGSVLAELPLKTVYQFSSNDTWLENVAVRSNGIVLTTEIGPPASLLAFDTRVDNPAKIVLATFDVILGLSGITEATHDVFYITGANTTSENISDPPKNATHVWKVDFNEGNDTHPAIDLVARPTTPTDFNGLTSYNETIILASATFESSVFALDAETGESWEAFEDELMSTINGIKAQDGYLYWTSNDGLCRASLYPNMTIGAGSIITNGTFDDFAVSPDGFRLNTTTASNLKWIYGATAAYNTIEQVTFDAATGILDQAVIVDGSLDSTTVAEPTGCAFGRGEGQVNKLYCTTGGGSGVGVEVDGVATAVGAQLIEITLY